MRCAKPSREGAYGGHRVRIQLFENIDSDGAIAFIEKLSDLRPGCRRFGHHACIGTGHRMFPSFLGFANRDLLDYPYSCHQQREFIRNFMNRSDWPFQHVLNSRRQDTGWVLLNGPIVLPRQQSQFAELRRGHYRFAGMSSYMSFPRSEPGDWLDYQTICEVWCHCFRNPDQFLQPSLPRALISASDFTDYMT